MEVRNIKRIDIKEFRQQGYLQEANRLFFHPLGLALEVKINKETGQESLGGIWDYRDDPEGVLYEEGALDTPEAMEKAANIEFERKEKAAVRVSRFGYSIQPIKK